LVEAREVVDPHKFQLSQRFQELIEPGGYAYNNGLGRLGFLPGAVVKVAEMRDATPRP